MLSAREESQALSDQWRSLRRSATFVAVLSAPAAFIWLWKSQDMALGWAIVATAVAVFAFRGLLDLVFRRFIPQPSLFALDSAQLREEDVLNRRRHWFWRSIYRVALIFAIFVSIVFFVQFILGGDVTWWGTASSIWNGFWHAVGNTSTWAQFIVLPIFFIFNFLILMGPMMMMGISQIKGFEPGDANWGVKLEDVRGQAEAKEEVRRIVNLWTVGRGVRVGRRQARARHPLPRRARHRQDDAREGDRDRVQLAVRDDPGLGICSGAAARRQDPHASRLDDDGRDRARRRGDRPGRRHGSGHRHLPAGRTRHLPRHVLRRLVDRVRPRPPLADQAPPPPAVARRERSARSRTSWRPTRARTGRTSRSSRTSSSRRRSFRSTRICSGCSLGDGCFTTTTPSLSPPSPSSSARPRRASRTACGPMENSGKPGAYYLTAGKRGRLANPLTTELRRSDCSGTARSRSSCRAPTSTRARTPARGATRPDGHRRICPARRAKRGRLRHELSDARRRRRLPRSVTRRHATKRRSDRARTAIPCTATGRRRPDGRCRWHSPPHRPVPPRAQARELEPASRAVSPDRLDREGRPEAGPVHQARLRERALRDGRLHRHAQHLHRRRCPDRPLPGAEGEAARRQVGRPVHRLHRRDRRGRHAALVARRVDDSVDHRALRRPLLLRAERLAHPVR